MKQELGWADFQVRADRAIRRHWELVCCAFCFCWWAESHDLSGLTRDVPVPVPLPSAATLSLPTPAGAGGKSGTGGARGSPSAGDFTNRTHYLLQAAVLAPGAAASTGLA